MPFLEDLGNFGTGAAQGYFNVKRFQAQNRANQINQYLREREVALAEQNLKTRADKETEQQAMRAQLKDLAVKYNGILQMPMAWDLKNHTVTDKTRDALAPIVAQMMQVDPQTGSDYLRHLDFIYNPPKEPKFKEPTREEKLATGLAQKNGENPNDPEVMLKYLAHVEGTLAQAKKSPTDEPVYPTPDEIKAFNDKAGKAGIVDPFGKLKVPQKIYQQSFKGFLEQSRADQAVSQANELASMRGHTLAESGIPANPDEPQSEADVLDKIKQLQAGQKPFLGYRPGRSYLQKAVQKNLLTQRAYDVVHNKYLSPAYPDTTK